eukprot:3896540-Pyramimonas_sp.AAC.1
MWTSFFSPEAFFRHPGDLYPPPLSSTGVDIQWHDDPARLGGGFEGHVFMDGPCFKHPVRELSRAGWRL